MRTLAAKARDLRYMTAMGYTKEVTVRSLYMRALQKLQAMLGEFAD
jgi:hypothetical protein